MTDADVAAMRGALVDRLLSNGQVHSAEVAEAFRQVPRHLFVPEVDPPRAYDDEAIPIKWRADGRPVSSSSQPAMMAIMLEQLALEAGHRVLEIGTGTGYNAALMTYLVGETGAVVTVDIDEELAETARRRLNAAGYRSVVVAGGDGAAGWPGGAPYDRGVFLRVEDDSGLDLTVLHAALNQPGQVRPTGVTVTSSYLFAGLGLWLALHDPRVGELTALEPVAGRNLIPAVTSRRGAEATMVLVGETGLAAVARPPGTEQDIEFECCVRGYGPDSDRLAERLATSIRAWESAGRPAGPALRIKAYPASVADHEPAAFTIEMPHTRFLLNW